METTRSSFDHIFAQLAAAVVVSAPLIAVVIFVVVAASPACLVENAKRAPQINKFASHDTK